MSIKGTHVPAYKHQYETSSCPQCRLERVFAEEITTLRADLARVLFDNVQLEKHRSDLRLRIDLLENRIKEDDKIADEDEIIRHSQHSRIADLEQMLRISEQRHGETCAKLTRFEYNCGELKRQRDSAEADLVRMTTERDARQVVREAAVALLKNVHLGSVVKSNGVETRWSTTPETRIEALRIALQGLDTKEPAPRYYEAILVATKNIFQTEPTNWSIAIGPKIKMGLQSECTGDGKCHGCMDWCIICGNVRHVCDMRLRGERCDSHPIPQNSGTLRTRREVAEKRMADAKRAVLETKAELDAIADDEQASREYAKQFHSEEL